MKKLITNQYQNQSIRDKKYLEHKRNGEQNVVDDVLLLNFTVPIPA